MEKTGSNRSNVEEQESGAENHCGQNGQPKRSRLKSKSRRALERTQSQSFNVVKGAGSAARRATLQLSAQSGEGQVSFWEEATPARKLPR